MKLTAMIVVGKGQRAIFDGRRPLVFTGPTRSGKTLRLLAVQSLVYSRGIPPWFVADDESEVEGIFEHDGEEIKISRKFNKGANVKVRPGGSGVNFANAWAMEHLGPITTWSMAEFLGLNDTDQRKMIESLVGVSTDDIRGAIEKVIQEQSGVPDSIREWALKQMPEDVGDDKIITHVLGEIREKRADEFRRLRDMEGHSRESARVTGTATGTLAEMRGEREDILEEMRDIRQQIGGAEERAQATGKRKEMVDKWRDELAELEKADPTVDVEVLVAGLEKKISPLRDEVATLPEIPEGLDLQEMFGEAGSDLTGSTAQIGALESKIAALEDATECPLCGCQGCDTGDITQVLGAMQFSLKALKDKEQAARKTLEDLRTYQKRLDLQAQIRAAEKALVNAEEKAIERNVERTKQHEERIDTIRKHLLDVEDLDAEKEIANTELLNAKHEGLKEAELRIREHIDSMVRAQESRKAWLEGKEKMATQRALVAGLDALKVALGPKGLMADQMVEPMREMVDNISEVLRAVEPGDSFGIKPTSWTWGIFRDGIGLIPYDACSDSEQALIAAGMAFAVSQQSKWRCLMINGIEILLSPQRERLLGFVGQAYLQGRLDNSFLTLSCTPEESHKMALDEQGLAFEVVSK